MKGGHAYQRLLVKMAMPQAWAEMAGLIIVSPTHAGEKQMGNLGSYCELWNHIAGSMQVCQENCSPGNFTWRVQGTLVLRLSSSIGPINESISLIMKGVSERDKVGWSWKQGKDFTYELTLKSVCLPAVKNVGIWLEKWEWVVYNSQLWTFADSYYQSCHELVSVYLLNNQSL